MVPHRAGRLAVLGFLVAACALDHPASRGDGGPDGVAPPPDAAVCGLASQPCCLAGGIANACAPGTACSADGVCIAGCPHGETTCDGRCTDLATDPQRCGDCATACALAHATARCVGGACVVGACAAGFGDCDGSPANGCEANLATSPLHCGRCETPCPAAGATASCARGACGIATCAAGRGDCDGDPANGCEADLTADPANCGSCGIACAFPHARAGCAAGRCALGACDAGFADCDGDPADGCEVNTQGSLAHCGGCGMVCRADHAAPTCASGHCQVGTCAAGYGDCDGNPANGCETALGSDPANCGACRAPCAAPAHATAVCTAGHCAPGACAGPWGDCDGSPANGCEADLTTVANCGHCAAACSYAHAATGCAAGRCVFGSCDVGWGDCGGGAADGCETDLRTSLTHCGACVTACGTQHAAATCSSGHCQITRCDTGWGDCNRDPADGCETDLGATAAHCGRCEVACHAQHATPACARGACAIGSCDTNWGDCNRDPADGCETDLTTTHDRCGRCDHPCQTDETCTGGRCGGG